ncbi:MAG TPA: GAF domain-containing protein, partial [Herpetosiphonaceae bacterium]
QRKQARELFVLYENSRTVGSSLDLRHILERLTENVVLALNVERSVVLLWNAQRRECEMVAMAMDDTANNDTLDRDLGSRYTPQPGSVAALVIASQQPVVINDVASDPRLGSYRANLTKRGVRSVLGVPLLLQDQLIGILISNTYSATRIYSVSEITLAQTLAGQAAVAIGNARLLSEERRRTVELSLLQDLAGKLNSGMNLNDTLATISNGVTQLLPDVDIEICLYDPESQVLRSQHMTEATRAIASETGTYGLEQGFSGWLARHRAPLRIGDIRQQRKVRPFRDGPQFTERFRSYLGLPLLVGEELIGTLELGSARPHRFDTEDERLLTIIGSQAAQAIRNVQRYEATDEVLRERVRELSALQRISRELTSTLRLEQLLPAMLSEIMQASGCANGLVALRQEDGGPFQIIAEQGFPASLQADRDIAPLLGAGPLAEALGRAEALVIDDRAQLEGGDRWPEPLTSILMAPIMYEEQVAGVIVAGDPQTFAFNRAALDFVRAVADQAALAIGNAQHFAEQVRQRDLLQQRASLLNEVLEIGNALRADMELSGLLEQIAFSVTESAGYRVVLFSLIDADQPGQLRTVTGAGLALSELEELQRQPIAVKALDQDFDPQFRLGRAYFIPAPGSDAAAESWQDSDRLLVPLYSTERELIGVMTVDDPFSRQRPNRRIVETLEIFANQAAIAVENARLFD